MKHYVLQETHKVASIVPAHTQESITIDASMHQDSTDCVDILVQTGAHATVKLLQHSSIQYQQKITCNIVAQADAHITFEVGILGGAYTECTVRVTAQEPGAEVIVHGAYILTGQQKVVIATEQIHSAPYTSTECSIKGILAGAAHVHYEGLITIDSCAHNSDANQQIKHILLSDTAHAKVIPSLQVLTDAVRCQHGAAVGSVDAEQLYYLQSRGITEIKARMMVVQSFIQDMMIYRSYQKFFEERIASII